MTDNLGLGIPISIYWVRLEFAHCSLWLMIDRTKDQLTHIANLDCHDPERGSGVFLCNQTVRPH